MKIVLRTVVLVNFACILFAFVCMTVDSKFRTWSQAGASAMNLLAVIWASRSLDALEDRDEDNKKEETT